MGNLIDLGDDHSTAADLSAQFAGISKCRQFGRPSVSVESSVWTSISKCRQFGRTSVSVESSVRTSISKCRVVSLDIHQ